MEIRGQSPISKGLSKRQFFFSFLNLIVIMHIRYFIGIDVSKATLDWAVFDGQEIVYLGQSANSEVGINTVVKLLKALPGFTVFESVCCMEHTGIVRHEVARFEYG